MRKISKESYEKIEELAKRKRVTVPRIQKELNISFRHAEIYKALFDNPDVLNQIFNGDVIEENVKLAKEKQVYQDHNRIERKAFRNHARVENAITALNKAVLENFSQINWNIKKFCSKTTQSHKDQMIIQLSDTHFNELVDMESNKYDFKIASKRLALYASEIKREIRANGIKKAVFAMTGDLINSDRRLDEKLNMATNRMNAAMIAVNLIQYFIQDLMEELDQLDVVYVTGNESRALEFGFTDIVVTDNYDTVIFNMLKLVFKNSDCIKFIDANPVEAIICINKKNFLLTHGASFGKVSQQDIQKFIGKYSSNGITIDYVLFGHIHFANIGDTFARSGSLVGENSYSNFGLGLSGKASQNIHIVKKNGTINNKRIELQNTDNVKGYPIRSDLDLYDAKSASSKYSNYSVVKIS